MPDSRWDWDDCPYSPQAPFLDADDPQSLLVGDLPLDADSSRRQQEPPGRSCDPASLDFSAGPANFGGNNDQPCVEYGIAPGLELQHPQEPFGTSAFTAYSSLSEMAMPIPDQAMLDPRYPPQYSGPHPDPYLHSPDYSASSYFPSISPSQPSDGVPDEYSTPMTPQDLPHYQGYDASTPEHKSQSKKRQRRKKNPEDLKRNQNKISRPEVCSQCGKGHAEKRDLDRHMVSNHKSYAKSIGLDVSKVKCKVCGMEFDNIRKDRLTKHNKKQHGAFY